MFHYDANCLYKNNKPWFPFMGEIHYSRLPAWEWRDALLKMKAGGITIAASYNFWIHHEEVKGEWDFDGSKNLKEFVVTIKDCGMYMLLRIGPWSHGEARNGGFPDWLMEDGCRLRSDDPAYLKYVKIFFGKLYDQVKGLFFKDGGPIIGIQIENEYGHVGGLGGEEGEQHMRTLAEMAKKIGFDAPLYTATGWGGAVTGGLLPVMGGYPDAPWDRRITDIEPSGNYVFSHERNDTSIGSDAGFGSALEYDPTHFPYLTAELGGGMMVTKHRRVVVSPQDIAAMSIAKLGSGVALLGYYMYHGGANPEGKLTTLEESKASGGYNDLPAMSYDFQCPLGAYGQYHGSYDELRLLGMFVADFGEDICTMPAIIPDDNPQDPTDKERLRYSFRHNGKWGYVFFNNHVRHMYRPRFPQVSIMVPGMKASDETGADVTGGGLRLPTFDIEPGQYGFYPFNMPVGGGVIKFAEATPLCKIGGTTVLYSSKLDNCKPQNANEGSGICVDEKDIIVYKDTKNADVLLISRKDALKAYKLTGATQRLVISNNPLIQDGDTVTVFATKDIKLKVYPKWDKVPEGFVCQGLDGKFAVYTRSVPANSGKSDITQLSDTRYRLDFSGIDPAHDYEICIKYTAESAKAYINGKFVMDDFYKDGQWVINLRRHGYPKSMEIELNPLNKDEPLYLEAWPTMENGTVCRVDDVIVTMISRVSLF